MIPDLMLSSFELVPGEWGHPIDPFLSSDRKIIYNNNRQIMINPIGDDVVRILMKKRTTGNLTFLVKPNLWRVREGLTEWKEFFSIELTLGNGSFYYAGLKFNYSLIKHGSSFNLGVSYEQRNGFAEEARQLVYGVQTS